MLPLINAGGLSYFFLAGFFSVLAWTDLVDAGFAGVAGCFGFASGLGVSGFLLTGLAAVAGLVVATGFAVAAGFEAGLAGAGLADFSIVADATGLTGGLAVLAVGLVDSGFLAAVAAGAGFFAGTASSVFLVVVLVGFFSAGLARESAAVGF